MRGGSKRWDDKLAAAKTEELERRQVIQVIDEEALQQGQEVYTVALACTLTFCWGCHDSSWPLSRKIKKSFFICSHLPRCGRKINYLS
jgi:hypothetical protein